MKKCWKREDYRIKLTEHLRRISPKGSETRSRLIKAGLLRPSEEARKNMSTAQKRRFERPEEWEKLAKARSLQHFDFQKRAQVMHEAFLRKYGSFAELAKMGMKAPKRKPNKLELEVARTLGAEWEYVGDASLEIGGLFPDFINRSQKKILEVLGCYYHACPVHFPNAPLSPKSAPAYREAVYKANGYEVELLWEHDVKERRKLAFKEAGVSDPSVYAK